jgi:hypothetical protein
MWEIITRKRVWEQVSHAWKIAELVSKGERLALPPNNPLNPLVERCWATEPDERPTFVEIYGELERIKNSLPASTLRTSYNNTNIVTSTVAADPYISTGNAQPRYVYLFLKRIRHHLCR